MVRFRGRQTQFYIDVVYGLAFSLGFGYLLLYGMDPRVAAFEGGLVFGYFLRVWENMSVYERVLESEVAEEAEAAVAEEVADQVPAEAEAQVAGEVADRVETEVAERVPGEVEDRVQAEMEDHVQDEVETQVQREVEEQVPDEVETQIEEQVPDEVETELVERVEGIDAELAAELRDRIEADASS